jgi:hypothetical protein
MQIPTIIIAISAGLAGVAWIFFARSQKGRRQAGALAWLSLPFFILCGIYIWFSLMPVEIDLRVAHARYSFLGISVSQAVILFIIAFWNKVR